MTIRAVRKKKRAQRKIVCPDCLCEMVPVVVMVKNLRGPDSEGISVQHVECETCGSSGKVKRVDPPACCCAVRDVTPCKNCAPKPSGMHVCEHPDFEDFDYAMRLAMMDVPARGVRTTAAAAALDLGSGWRSGQRGGR